MCVSTQPVVHFKLYLSVCLQSREKERKAGRKGRMRRVRVSLLSGGSEFVQKDKTLFTVSLRTLTKASSKGRPHLQVTWVPVSIGSS